MRRCEWATDDPLYRSYHDREWGVPLHDDRSLFEMLILEGSQAGLSWLTVLRRRDNYRKAYDNFAPERMAAWSDDHLKKLLNDPSIIRNRLKVEAARTNARAYMRLIEGEGSFARFLWSFVDGRPVCHGYQKLREIPASTPESDRLSLELKKRGFKFVGSTICYAFMQGVGMVNDHQVSCFRFEEINRLARSVYL